MGAGPTAFERLEAEWADLRVAFEARVVDWHRGLPVSDGLACIRSALGFLDEFEPVDGMAVDDPSGPPESPIVAALRRATFEAYGEAAAAIEIAGATIDRLTAFTRLATVEDAAERRAVFEAMAPVWRAVDGDGGVTSP